MYGKGKVVRDPKSLSSLELLPHELIWKLIESAPEAVLDLRLTCRMLHSRVHDYVYRPNPMRLISSIKLTEERDSVPQRVKISMEVPLGRANLFELRLKSFCLRKPSYFLSRMDRLIYDDSLTIYLLTFDSGYDDEAFINFLRRCIGETIGVVAIECEDESRFHKTPKLLEPFVFGKLVFTIDALSKEAMENLMTTIIKCKVEELSLSATIIESDPVDLFTRLSSLVRALEIVQMKDELEPRSNTYLFGAENRDWVPVIHDMFSRKLDKLKIDNRHYPGYLPQLSIDMFRATLTELIKNVWFTATCYNDIEKFSYVHDEYYVKVEESAECCTFSLKHSTRTREKFFTEYY